MSLEVKFEKLLKEKCADEENEQKLRSKYFSLSNWFLRDFGGRQATKGRKTSTTKTALDSRTRLVLSLPKVVRHYEEHEIRVEKV